MSECIVLDFVLRTQISQQLIISQSYSYQLAAIESGAPLRWRFIENLRVL